MIKIYTDGSCLKNPGNGGWAAIIFINNEKIVIDTAAIRRLLVTAANIIESVTSLAERGANNMSTILPWIFPIMIDDDECENACWMICIAIKPGAKKVING